MASVAGALDGPSVRPLLRREQYDTSASPRCLNHVPPSRLNPSKHRPHLHHRTRAQAQRNVPLSCPRRITATRQIPRQASNPSGLTQSTSAPGSHKTGFAHCLRVARAGMPQVQKHSTIVRVQDEQSNLLVDGEEDAFMAHSSAYKGVREQLYQRTRDSFTIASNAYSPHGIRFAPTPQLRAPRVDLGYSQSAPVIFSTSVPVNNSGGEPSPNSSAESSSDSGAGNRPAQGPSHSPNSVVENKEDNMSEAEYSTQDEQPSESDGESSSETENQEAEHTPLSFQIPEAVLRTAMQASPNSEGSFYNHLLYRGPENQTVSLHYCSSMEIADRVAPYFENEEVLGFDIEWKPFASPNSIKENASLIQIACEDRIALFHISRYKGETAEELLPEKLKEIIESPTIRKVGVAIKGDFSRLEKYLGVKPLGVFELSRLHNLVAWSSRDAKQANSKKLYSLAKQVHEHLQLPLHKGAVRESDWSENKTLNSEQLRYAATDAYASYRIFDVLDAKRKKLKPIPPLPELCDYDSMRRPRAPAKKTTKAAPKTTDVSTAEQDTAESTARLGEEQVDESEEYETAPEELMDSQDLEASSESESSDESLDYVGDSDSDADYVPPSRRVGRLRISAGEDDSALEPGKRRAGHLYFTALVGPDPGYPRLPTISSEEENDSDSSDAFDPPVTRLKQRVPKAGITPTKSISEQDLETEDASDEESMPEQFASLNINEEEGETRSMAANTSNSTDEQFQPLAYTSPILHQDKGGEWSFDPTPRKEPEGKGKAKALDATTAHHTSVKSAPEQSHDTSAPSTSHQPNALSKSTKYTHADFWAHSYLDRTIPTPAVTAASSTPSRIHATVSQLRAYHLWHHQSLGVDEISNELRDPPLAQSTVCGYILQAVTIEKLEYREEELSVLLKQIPLRLRMTRYKWLVGKAGGVS